MIYTEDQIVKVNGVVLPGLVKSIEVKESAKIDEQEVEGSATKPKQATGYEDAKVNIELILDDTPTQTKYQRLETLRAIFRTPGQSVPKPLSIVSEDTAAHGVDKVLFKGLTHKMENKKEQLTVSLEFWEYVPQTIQTTSSSSGSSSGGGSRQGLTDAILTREEEQDGNARIILPSNRGPRWPLHLRQGRRDRGLLLEVFLF